MSISDDEVLTLLRGVVEGRVLQRWSGGEVWESAVSPVAACCWILRASQSEIAPRLRLAPLKIDWSKPVESIDAARGKV